MAVCGYPRIAPRWWWKARPSELYLTETATMLFLGPLLVLAGIASFCWLLFTLAAFALPFFVGLTVGMWAFHTGAGALGGIIVGVVAGGATFGIGQLLLAFAPWNWLRLLIIRALRRARRRRRLQRHAWDCSDGHAIRDLANCLLDDRRHRYRHNVVRPFHRYDRGGPVHSGRRTELKPTRHKKHRARPRAEARGQSDRTIPRSPARSGPGDHPGGGPATSGIDDRSPGSGRR